MKTLSSPVAKMLSIWIMEKVIIKGARVRRNIKPFITRTTKVQNDNSEIEG